MLAVQYWIVQVWKLLGLAGLVGATVVGLAAGTRAVQRKRRAYREADADELRSRLHERLAAADGASAGP